MKTVEILKQWQGLEKETRAWRQSLLIRLRKEEPITKETQALIDNLEACLKE